MGAPRTPSRSQSLAEPGTARRFGSVRPTHRCHLPLILLIAALGAPRGAQAVQITEPADTFADDLSRELVAPLLRDRAMMIEEGLLLLVTNRLRIGIEVPDQWLWRDRSLFRRESATIFELDPPASGELRLVARARGSPLLGDASLEWEGPVAVDPEAQDPFLGVVGLALDDVADPMLFRPQQGLLAMLGTEFIDPISPGAPSAYRYRATDTIRVDLPEPMTLAGVQVRPRAGAQQVFEGTIWFDTRDGRLVRMVVRPEGLWDLAAGLRGILEEIPLVQKDAQGRIDYLAVHFMRAPSGHNLPVYAELEGSVLWMGELFWMPVSMEWAASATDERLGAFLPNSPPPSDSLRAELVPPRLSAGWSFAVPRREVNPFLRELDRVVERPPPPTLKETGYSVVGSFRYNQVQGLSAGVRYPYPVGSRETLTGELRIPTSGFHPTGSAEFRRHLRPIWWSVSGYSELQDANRWERPLGLWNSLEALLFGQDDGNYYLATGASLNVGGENRPLTWNGGLFWERQENVPTLTTFSLFGSEDEDEDQGEEEEPRIPVDEGDFFGLRAQARLQWGDDPQRHVVVLRAAGEIAGGAFAYRDLELGLDVVGPIGGGLAGAFRLSYGRASGQVPTQRLYYLGGRKTVRGFERNSANGPSYFLAKFEVGSRVPAMRVVAFTDLGWAGEPGELFELEPITSVGIGVSVLDGILRTDLAWGVRGGHDFRIHFYTSGLF